MDSDKLKDEEEKINNGETNSEIKHDEFDSNSNSPLIQSAPTGFTNGKSLDESPSSSPSKPVKPLKKWRRIRREFTKSVSPDYHEEGSPAPGRDLTDLSDLVVQMHKRRIPLPDTSRNPHVGDDKEEEEEESSVASVESRNTGLNQETTYISPPVISLDPDAQLMINTPIFSIGAVDSENSEDRSSKSSTAASVPRFRRDTLFGRERGLSNQRAPRGSRGSDIIKKNYVKFEAENSNSNSNAVSNGKFSEKSVNYDGENNSDEGLQGEVRSGYCRENGETGNSNPGDLDSEEGKDGFENPDLDPLADSVFLLETTHETLETELEKWANFKMEVESEEFGWNNNSPNSKFEIGDQNEMINHLKSKLVEKDARLFEIGSHLNQTLIQSDLDQLMQEKFEFEIQSLVITKTVVKWKRTLEDSKAFVEEQKLLISKNKKLNLEVREMENKQGLLKGYIEKLEDDLKDKDEKIEILDSKNKTYNTSFVYIIELGLVGIMLAMFLMFLLPDSSDVVPT